MLATLELLTRSPIVKSFTILDFKQGSDFYFLKCSAILKDDTELHLREYVSDKEFIYSYHWQNQNGDLIIRWDNAPHHPDLSTHPHHKHSPALGDSHIVCFKDLIEELEKKIL